MEELQADCRRESEVCLRPKQSQSECALVFFLHACLCEGVGSSGTGVTVIHELPHGCWELNPVLLEERPVLLSTEPSLQPHDCYRLKSTDTLFAKMSPSLELSGCFLAICVQEHYYGTTVSLLVPHHRDCATSI